MTQPLPEKPKSSLPLIARVLRSNKLQNSLLWLEKLTENSKIESENLEVVTADKLSNELLEKLFNNEILALHIPGFCSEDVCNKVAENALRKKTRNWSVRDVENNYKKSDVNVIGNPFNLSISSDKSWEQYFNESNTIIDEIRELSEGMLSPLDKFRLEADEIYKYGLNVRSYQNNKMTPGLVRIMNDNTDDNVKMPLNCHVDDTPIISNKKGQYSVNIYVKPAKEGGEFAIWDPNIGGAVQFIKNWSTMKNFFLKSNYNNPDIQKDFQSKLPKPKILKAGKGDLIMLNTSRPHAICPMKGGPRVSLQSFLTFQKEKPIKMWV